uniref:DUF4371 domain-containing protein n=1 Tax=Latimeria chalumnae TaxID=7897 RepID=H3ATM6_LATCH
KNLKVLETITETIILCGRQNLPMQGHRDDKYTKDSSLNTGNFQALLEYRASRGGDDILREHLKNAPRNVTYVSKTVQNEILDIIGSMIQQHIITECKSADGWLSVSADETRDVNKEQLSVTIWYSAKDDSIKENFVGFLDVSEDTTDQHLSAEILHLLQCLDLDLNRMKSQCYDGAGSMSGMVKGVAARIQEKYPKALPLWCTSHQLNRCVVQAYEITTVRNMMDAADEVFSPQKQQKLSENIDLFVKSESKHAKLKRLCTTRWVQRHDAFEVFIDFLPAIVETLDHFSKLPNTWHSKSILTVFKFIVCLIVVQRCLAYLKGLTVCLQERALDISRAFAQVSVVKKALEENRSNVGVHTGCFQEACSIAEKLEYLSRSQEHTRRDNMPADTPQEYFRKAITIPFLGHLLAEMGSQFMTLQERAAARIKLVPSVMNTRPCPSDFEFFTDDLPSSNTFASELHQWFRMWKDKKTKPSTVSQALEQCDGIFFPNIKCVLQVCATFPVTSCECECSISALRLLKSYLRSTMGQERVTALAPLYIH